MPTLGFIKPNLFVGPAIAINISAKGKAEYEGHVAEGDIEDVKDTDIGLVFGGGVDFSLITGKITFDARYILGLTTPGDFGINDVKNEVISVLVGYAF